MNTRLLLLSLIILISKHSFSQNLPEIVPPSPEASALIRHSQMDVSLYTGTPNISVPFHTISFHGVNVPIGISYNSGGIKVDDIASWAGLGWNLSAGGLVSRSIRSLPDDATTYGYMNTIYTVEDLFQRDPNDMSSAGQQYQLISFNAAQRDYEPDIFNFSFPGGSGQFFYDQTSNKFVQTPNSNLKIETKLSSNKIVGFIITDTAGIKYHFGTSSNNARNGLEANQGAKTKSLTLNGIYESSASVYGTPTSPYYQTWMLMDIEFPSSFDTIEFYYTTETNVKTAILQNEEKIHSTISSCSDEYNIVYLEKEFTQPKLSSIVFPSGEVSFEKGTSERSDLKNSYPLKKIKLLNEHNQLIKGIELHTSYFTSAVDTNSPFDYYNEGIYRLKLDSISQFGSALNTLPAYKFEYNTKILPDRFARSKDYFGYYNGKTNTTLIPKAKYGLTTGYIGDANRSVDPSFTGACNLEKVIYPTGGYDEFVWDNNKVSAFTGDATDYVDFLTEETANLVNDSYLYPDPDPLINYSNTFTISSNSDGVVEFDIFMSGCNDPIDFNDRDCDFILNVVGVTNPSFSFRIYDSSFYYTFPTGTYKITAKTTNSNSCDPLVDPNCTNNEILNAQLKWSTDPTPGQYIYGGLRISQINTYASPTELAISRNFSYNNFAPLNTNLDSGIALNFIDLSMSNYHGGGCSPSGVSGIKITSNSQAQASPTKGSLVGYINVTETYSGTTGNGRKAYTFSPPSERVDNPYMGTGYYDSPYPSNFENPVYNDWVSGNLEKMEIYNASDNLLQKVENEYETASTTHKEYYGVQILRMPPHANNNDNMYITTYTSTTEWHRLKSNTTTEYLGGHMVVSTQDNYYNNNHPLLVSEIKTSTSDGESIITKTFYPDDVVSTSALGADNLTTLEKDAVDLLKTNEQHRIAEPIQSETYKDINKNGIADSGELISRQRTNYKNWDSDLGLPSNTNLILPEFIQTSKEDSTPLVDRIQFISYYNTGNVKEVKKTDGTTIVYIWGYDEEFPIAKIENATYSQVSSQVANIQSKSNLDDDTCLDYGSCDEKNLRTALIALRNSLPSAMVTTYTYNPLVGVTSVTDPKGYIMYYEYDEFNRLKNVKDADGFLLSENEYNYKQ